MATETGLVLDGLVVGPWRRTLLGPTTLAVPAGSSLAVLGDAGTGKTTVLETLAGRRRPEAGAVRVDGSPPLASMTGFASSSTSSRTA